MAKLKKEDLLAELKFLLDSGNGLKSSNLNSLIHKLPYNIFDRELVVKLASHPSVTITALQAAFDYTYENDRENIDNLVSSYIKNTAFNSEIWDFLAGFIIKPKYCKIFLLCVARFLSGTSSQVDSKKLKIILEYAIFNMSEDYEIKVCGRDTIIDCFLSIFDNVNFSIDSVLAPLKDILLSQKFTPLMLDGTINEAMHKSKNAIDIINYMFEITGNPDYLAQDVKDIFWFP